MWKILIAHIREEEIYYSLVSFKMFPEGQKRCYEKTSETDYLKFISQDILCGGKWIHGVAHHMIPQIWIVDSLKWSNISDLKIEHGNHEKLESRIDSRRKNFNSSENPERYLPRRYVSPLVFLIAMMPLNYVYIGSTLEATGLQKRRKRLFTLCKWTISSCLQKMKKNRKLWYKK